jgi:hypothetical protein
MPQPLITRLRSCGRQAVAIAAVLMIVQAFLAGLTNAQAALLGAGADFAVICHGSGGAPPEPGTAPGEKQHPCCETCTAGAPPAVLPLPAAALRTIHCQPCGSPALRAVAIPLAPRAVRAGPSQAPPSLPRT